MPAGLSLRRSSSCLGWREGSSFADAKKVSALSAAEGAVERFAGSADGICKCSIVMDMLLLLMRKKAGDGFTDGWGGFE
eukprot:4586042-Pleurochrysis_carterae.AAC.1